MKKYIDVKKAIKAVEDLHDCYNGFSDTYDKACIIGLLQEVPTEDVAPVKHAYWTTKRTIMHDGETYCSECEYEAENKTTYCPNCGAKMGEGE